MTTPSSFKLGVGHVKSSIESVVFAAADELLDDDEELEEEEDEEDELELKIEDKEDELVATTDVVDDEGTDDELDELEEDVVL